LAANLQYDSLPSSKGSGMRGIALLVATGFVIGGTMAVAATPGSSSTRAGNGQIALVESRSSVLVSVNPDGSGRRVLARCRDSSTCRMTAFAWSPDGGRLLFFRAEGQSRSYSLDVVDAGGRTIRRLARCGYCGLIVMGSGAAWSPDSSSIAFSGANGLFVVDVKRGMARRLTLCGTRCIDHSPAWSPDGSKIAFVRVGSLYTVNPDGSAVTKLTSVPPFVRNPAWSPDGRRLTFEGTDQIYVIDVDGSHQTVLLDGSRGSGPGASSWSPDGTSILYFNTPGTPGAFTAEVWVMKPDGTEQRRLYHSGCCVLTWSPPIWSPDGTSIAFSADSAGGVRVMNSDGSDLRTLSATPSEVAWQPSR
jgi:Tol biopolymer transport system component